MTIKETITCLENAIIDTSKMLDVVHIIDEHNSETKNNVFVKVSIDIVPNFGKPITIYPTIVITPLQNTKKENEPLPF